MYKGTATVEDGTTAVSQIVVRQGYTRGVQQVLSLANVDLIFAVSSVMVQNSVVVS